MTFSPNKKWYEMPMDEMEQWRRLCEQRLLGTHKSLIKHIKSHPDIFTTSEKTSVPKWWDEIQSKYISNYNISDNWKKYLDQVNRSPEHYAHDRFECLAYQFILKWIQAARMVLEYELFGEKWLAWQKANPTENKLLREDQ